VSARSSQVVNAVLLGTALALVVLVVATRDKITTSEAEARSNNLLQAYDETDVARVRFERKEGSFTLVRTKMDDAGTGTWTITEPMREDAEPFSVQKILGTLELSSFVRRIKPEEVNRAAFGLDDPSLVIHVDMGKVRYRLRLGVEAASPKGARYLEIAGEEAPGKGVVLVSKSLVAELDLKLDEFRERYVMPYLSTVLSRLSLEGAGGTRKLRRAEWPDGFRFDGMLGEVRASRSVLNSVLVQFARTRAEHFLDPGEAEKALAGSETVTVTMTPLDPKRPVGIVEVGGKCPGSEGDVVALRRKPDRIAACVPRTVLSGFTTEADALVDRTLFWMRPDEVEGFEVKRGEARLALDRKENGFVMRAPEEGNVDAEAGNGRLEAILRATGPLVSAPDEKLGLAEPFGRVAVKSAAADDSKIREEVVTFSVSGADGTVYAKRQQDGAVVELGREAARALVADGVLVRSRTLIDAPIADVARIEVDGALHQIVERSESGTFTIVAPAGFRADGTLALELSDALRSLTAERWVVGKDDGTFGLEAPVLFARLTLRKDGKLEDHILRLGKAVAAGYYAAEEGTSGVFVVPRRLHETLTTLVLDRSVMMMDPSVTAKLVLESGGRTVVLEKRGEDFVETDTGEPLSLDSIRRIVDTLSALRAEAAVDVGPPRPEQGFDRPTLTVRIDRDPGHAGLGQSVTFRVGSGDSFRNMSVQYVRVDGILATYAVARGSIRALLDAF
jgi:hypothetical protein